MYDSIYIKCPEQANPQRQKQIGGDQGQGGGGMRSNCLAGTGFLLGDMKTFWNQIEGVDVLNATELFTLKELLWTSLMAQWLRIRLPMQGTRV